MFIVSDVKHNHLPQRKEIQRIRVMHDVRNTLLDGSNLLVEDIVEQACNKLAPHFLQQSAGNKPLSSGIS